MILMPISIRVHFRNLEIPSPVVGKLGGLIPRFNPTVSVSTNVTNDPIEEELRLPVSIGPRVDPLPSPVSRRSAGWELSA